MEQGNKAFNEVRALLGKLDRSIDEARSRRLGPPEQTESSGGNYAKNAQPEIDLDQEIGGSKPQAQTELQKRGAQFGRAKPLNRNANSWQTPGSDDLEIG